MKYEKFYNYYIFAISYNEMEKKPNWTNLHYAWEKNARNDNAIEDFFNTKYNIQRKRKYEIRKNRTIGKIIEKIAKTILSRR